MISQKTRLDSPAELNTGDFVCSDGLNSHVIFQVGRITDGVAEITRVFDGWNYSGDLESFRLAKDADWQKRIGELTFIKRRYT